MHRFKQKATVEGWSPKESSPSNLLQYSYVLSSVKRCRLSVWGEGLLKEIIQTAWWRCSGRQWWRERRILGSHLVCSGWEFWLTCTRIWVRSLVFVTSYNLYCDFWVVEVESYMKIRVEGRVGERTWYRKPGFYAKKSTIVKPAALWIGLLHPSICFPILQKVLVSVILETCVSMCIKRSPVRNSGICDYQIWSVINSLQSCANKVVVLTCIDAQRISKTHIYNQKVFDKFTNKK